MRVDNSCLCSQQQRPAPVGNPAAAVVVVIAATNRAEDLDGAVLRRFESRVYVGAPDCAAREMMVRRCLQDIEHCLCDEQITVSISTGSVSSALCHLSVAGHRGVAAQLERLRHRGAL